MFVGGKRVIRITFVFGGLVRCVHGASFAAGLALTGIYMQWPPESLIPGFRETLTAYLDAVQQLSMSFSSLVSEALGMGPDGLSRFYDRDELMQHRAKIVKYPVPTHGTCSFLLTLAFDTRSFAS